MEDFGLNGDGCLLNRVVGIKSKVGVLHLH